MFSSQNYSNKWGGDLESSSDEYNSHTDQEDYSRPSARNRIKPNLRARPVPKQKKVVRKRRLSSSDEEESSLSEDEPTER